MSKMSVVQSSNSIYSTYISTIDHLPCDIVRSLWLVQSCNISAEKEKSKLHHFLQKYKPGSLSSLPEEEVQQIGTKYSQLKQRILKCNEEALAEIESLHAQLVAHNEELDRTIANAEASEVPPAENLTVNQAELRAQLNQHYEKHPLTSQVEALQEQKLSKNVIVRQVKGLAKLKIIFKIPKAKRKELSNDNNSATNFGDIEAVGDDVPLESSKLLFNSIEQDSIHHQTRKSQFRKKPKRTESKPSILLERNTRGAGASRKSLDVVPQIEMEEYEEPTPEPEPEQYCFCKQPSFGDMIACDNRKCPNGEWFHYKCVGLLNKVEARKYTKQKWYCSNGCEQEAADLENKRKMKIAKKRKRSW